MVLVVSVVFSVVVDFGSVISDVRSVEAYDASVVREVRSILLIRGSVEEGVGSVRGVVVLTVSGSAVILRVRCVLH